jgi:hypothetical protein
VFGLNATGMDGAPENVPGVGQFEPAAVHSDTSIARPRASYWAKSSWPSWFRSPTPNDPVSEMGISSKLVNVAMSSARYTVWIPPVLVMARSSTSPSSWPLPSKSPLASCSSCAAR